ncbi:uncharacterized protein LOC124281748 [Haliotis rubra]|uniref:uncharacterized protein LOC124281748 n=1 Tax=Haliotis rubra TaxID=36100 RepID=UPI001EE5C326|nr:uncharacterized protein LOC124281748 [Haliotis rubra]
MDTFKRCLTGIVFSCLCSMMSNAFTPFSYTTTSYQVIYGGNCYAITQCKTTNASCNWSGICECADTHYYDAASDTCTQEVIYGGNCYTITQCNTTNAICNGFGICACADTHYYDAASGTCTQEVEYGASCDTMTQCNTTNAVCNGSGICACDYTHYYDAANDTCTQKQNFGDVCTETSQCDTTSDSNIVCIQAGPDKRCLCKNGRYRPYATFCAATTVLKPVIRAIPTIGTGNIGMSWTSTDVTGGYTSSYTVTWSPGSPGSVATAQKSYNIQSLSPGTTYTVTVIYTITQHGRNQTITSEQRTFTTKQVFGGVCSNQPVCDTTDPNIQCIQTTASNMKCLCKDGMYKSLVSALCMNTSPLKPVITGAPSIGTRNIVISWTSTDVTGGYTSSYTVTWSPGSPGSPGSAATTRKSYNIQSLSPVTAYTVTVIHTITQHGRSQTITSDQRTFTTRIGYNEPCTQTNLCYDASANCYSGRCRCDPGFFRNTICVSINQLHPNTVTAIVQSTTAVTASWTAPSNAVVTGYEVTVTPGDITPISVGRDIRTTPITGLTPGRVYTVNVKTKITYLPGRDEMTDAVSAAPKQTQQGFGGLCTDGTQCDTSDQNIACVQTTEKRCLCKNGMYKSPTTSSCTETSVLKPNITSTPAISTGNIDISWTHPDVTGRYTSSYTVTWSPGSPGSSGSSTSAPTTQKSYTIQRLSPGTAYSITVRHTITLYGRSQTISSDPRTFTTRIGYNETCTQNGLCYDANANCYADRCRCDPSFYRNTICVSINQLRPTTVTADEQSTTTMTAAWTAPSNDVVTGYEVSVTPGDITPISVNKDIRTTPITGLTPGKVYTVNVKTKIMYLQGRNEMTDAASVASKQTQPASVVGLDVIRTNRTAPDITVVFAKAIGDATMYIVTLRGRDGDTYNQQRQPVNTGQGLISVVFTGVVAAVSYNLSILTQSGNLQSLPYTNVIRVGATPAGIVTNLKSFDNTSRSVAVEWRRPVNPNGKIYEYIVDVRTGGPSVCVKRVIINCTECNRDMANFTKMETECDTTMTVVIAQADIENTAHVIQHNITRLNPDTSYTIDVVAVIEEEPGTTDQINLHTPEEGAGNTTNFKAQSRSSSEITLTWDPPQPRPGVTRYNITVYEKQEDSEGYDTLKFIALSGWGIKTYTIGNLSSYWFYKFDIVAETKLGASAIITSGPEMTMESEPTGVLELKVEDITDVFNQVQVSWKCPKQKDGRNGKIVIANLHYSTKQTSTFNPIRGNKNFTNNGDCLWNVKVDVTTEFMYLFEVRLYNKGFAGSVVGVSKDIVGGAPLQSAVMESVKKGAGETEETVSLNICPKCLNDRTNGQVNITGMMVCKTGASCGQSRKRRATTSAADYNEIANWNKASANSFNVEYRATKQDWLAGNVGKLTLTFTLGEEDCSGNLPGAFCNGKLPAGETFIVYAFTCTNHGCTTSQKIEVTTKASFPIAAVVGGLVAAVVVIVVVIIVVVIRRRRNTKMKQADPSLIETADDLIQRKRPIRMKDFEKRVEEMHKDSNLLFSEEFEDIGALSPSTRVLRRKPEATN